MAWVLGPKAAADNELRQAAGRLRQQGVEIDVRLTWESGDGSRWARELIENGAQAIVAAGGDGT